MKKFKENNKGFSLVELIVVIAIMVVLIAVLGSTILGYVDKSKYSKDISALDSINTAVKTFVADPSSGTYTDGQEYTLAQLIKSFDDGGVILPILGEVFAVGSVKNTSDLSAIQAVKFNNASKSFKDVTLDDVMVIIDKGAVSVSVKTVAGSEYAPYVAGTKYDKISGETT